MDNDQKAALITGGASGMGLAIATMLANRGWKIFILDFNGESGQKAAKDIGATFYEVDIRDYTALATVFDQAMNKAKRIDFVFANAGITDPRTFYNHVEAVPPPEPDWSVLDINLKGAISCVYLAQHYFRLTKRTTNPKIYDPTIIVTSSMAALVTAPDVPIYTAAKSGLVGFVRAIAPEFSKKDGIRVSCICPGLVITNMSVVSGSVNLPEHLRVPMETVCQAIDSLLHKDGGFGRVLRLLPDGITDAPRLPELEL